MHAQSEADVLQLAFFMLIKLSSDDRFPIRKGLGKPKYSLLSVNPANEAVDPCKENQFQICQGYNPSVSVRHSLGSM